MISVGFINNSGSIGRQDVAELAVRAISRNHSFGVDCGLPGVFLTSKGETNWYGKNIKWLRGTQHTLEQIVSLLQQHRRVAMRKWMRGCVLVVALIMTYTARGQAAFEVATVTLAAPLDMAKMTEAMQAEQTPNLGPHVEGGRAQYTYMTLRELIALTYSLKPYQVNGPDWLATTRFDIDAKMPEGAPEDAAPAMLQTLLKERFKLTAHQFTEVQPVLALVVSKSGSRLKPAMETPTPIDENTPLKPGEIKMDSLDGHMRVKVNSDGSTTMNMGVKGIFIQKMDMETKTLHIQSSAMTMAGLADMLTRVTQIGDNNSIQVVDMTGLKGYYEVNLDISLAEILAIVKASGIDLPARDRGQSSGVSGPDGGQSALESVQELGLRLEARKASVDRLVIDSVAKTPTEN